VGTNGGGSFLPPEPFTNLRREEGKEGRGGRLVVVEFERLFRHDAQRVQASGSSGSGKTYQLLGYEKNGRGGGGERRKEKKTRAAATLVVFQVSGGPAKEGAIGCTVVL